ncbi:MOB kinase activator-like 1A [Denticeps clupeoides]|uniref:MOB kinase activator-like 1A n=1 Tax=Denticeps clupeoides TaxID=299321 RepID=UPI0010A5128F|nr:MOB kinase activator-like 1A [Denticeps clupeoides]
MFFQLVSTICGALSELCTIRSCPAATGPGKRVYFWTDGCGRRLNCSAPLYIDYATSYIQELLTDELVFPTMAGSPFPSGFVFLVQKIFLLLFRMLAHLYSAHQTHLVSMQMQPHFNTLFTHFIIFSHSFSLLELQETTELQDIMALTQIHTYNSHPPCKHNEPAD